MSTASKDFKVKNGIQVAEGGSFGGPVVVGTPTSSEHATTKGYVDALAGRETFADYMPPSSPPQGAVWLDMDSEQLKIYYGGVWFVVGQITSYPDGGIPAQSVFESTVDGGGPYSEEFEYSLDAGSV